MTLPQAQSAPPGTAPDRLRMQGVHKRFGATVALQDVDLHVRAGEVLALVGENGAGKSTLMKILSGVHAPNAGSMWLDGRPYAPRNPLDARRAGVAMIYQELAQAPHLSVAENILLGIEPTRGPVLDWHTMRRRAADALAQLGRPNLPLNAPVGQLSAAERQLVEIARAIAVGCRVLVLDEPTSSLTSQEIGRLFDLVRRLSAAGHAIVYISHFLEEVEEIADRFSVLRDGRSVGGGDPKTCSREQIIAMMVGRDVHDLYPHSQREPGAVVLEIDALSGETKPRGASLQLHCGEVVGIAGLVGAGRTELLRAVFGLDPVRDGRVRVAAHVGPGSPARRWAQGVGLVSEDRKTEGLALGLSIGENMTLTRLPRWIWPGARRRAARVWIDRLGIRCQGPDQMVKNLSGGNQQKVAVARLLHHDVDVLLLDEPTRGVDVGAKSQIYALIDELAKAGKAVLMVSSYLPELLGTCDRIAVMSRGRLGPARPVGELDEHAIMAEAIGAHDAS